MCWFWAFTFGPSVKKRWLCLSRYLLPTSVFWRCWIWKLECFIIYLPRYLPTLLSVDSNGEEMVKKKQNAVGNGMEENIYLLHILYEMRM